MSAQRISVVTIDFPDPNAINYENNKFNTLNDSVSFQYRIPSNIQTLSTKGVSAGSDPYGILYVPDLHTDGCKSNESEWVPSNVTRLANIPANKNYALIAVAPWFSPQCMIEYFTSARRTTTTKAILVFQPGQGNARPPVLNDASWNLADGGSWQSANSFPTYAISSTTGKIIADQLGQYSGNLTDVPNGQDLAQSHDPTDYVRLWAAVSTDSPAQLPSLWVFLVIVLAILVVAVVVTSIAMHVIQRRRRNDLRRRVLAGQVDLEALGVKRLKVSQEILDKLPVYTYTAAATSDPEKSIPQPPEPALGLPSASADKETGVKAAPLLRRASVPAATGASSSLVQPTCPICLDDFESNETQVRELPCRHIFHPDCIDQFLLCNSSLCPMCKQSVLPVGACPVVITNMMVRRERHINRMRARGAQSPRTQSSSNAPSSPPTSRPPGTFGSLGSRIGGAMAGRRIFSAPVRSQTRPSDIEMADANTPTQPYTESVSPAQPASSAASLPATPANGQNCTPSQNRREWARQRALQLLGNRHVPGEADEEESGPRWRRTIRKAFPGFR